MTIKSVAIIGGGPSGTISLDALLSEKSFDTVKLFERREEVGGAFTYYPEPPEKLRNVKELHERVAHHRDELPTALPASVPKTTTQRFMDTATYSYLETNVEAVAMQFSQEFFPEGGSEVSIKKYGPDTPFRHHSVIKKWVQDLYKKKGYDDHVQLNTSVELVEQDSTTGKYTLYLKKFGEDNDYVWHEDFDAVVVATGHYDVPYVPNIPGLQQYLEDPTTTVIHSKAYRSREEFRNKKTVVVGASISAMDAVQDILNVAQTPVVSSQRSTSKPHKYFGDVAFRHPAVSRRQEIVKIDPKTKTLYFENGDTEADVDAIIFGTGFSYSYPFLPQLDTTHNRVQNLYQHVFLINNPTLAFVGAIQAGLTFKAFEWQAVVAARVFAGRASLPLAAEQQKWVDDRVKEFGNGPAYTSLSPDFEGYFETIRKIAGDDGPGRKLPQWDPAWEASFWRGAELRMNFWKQNNEREPGELSEDLRIA